MAMVEVVNEGEDRYGLLFLHTWFLLSSVAFYATPVMEDRERGRGRRDRS